MDAEVEDVGMPLLELFCCGLGRLLLPCGTDHHVDDRTIDLDVIQYHFRCSREAICTPMATCSTCHRRMLRTAARWRL